MATGVKIIGIGSPFGDDRLGWIAAQRLRESSVIGEMDIAILDRPGTSLVAHWKDADTVVVIDAIRSGATPGTVHCLTPGDIDGNRPSMSSHGFALESALALANALGELPRRLFICGIEADIGLGSDELSAAAEAAIPVLVRRMEQLIQTPDTPVPVNTVPRC